MKKYAGVKDWVNNVYNASSSTWDKNLVILKKDTAVPVIKKYAGAIEQTCTWTDDEISPGTHTLTIVIIGT